MPQAESMDDLSELKELAFPTPELIHDAIVRAEGLEDHDLSSAFRKRDQDDPGAGWLLLAQVFDFLFHAHNAGEPFGPMAVMNGKRSIIPEDLTEAELSALEATLMAVDDPEYRARIGDVLWLRRRNVKAARIAVEAYVAAGARVEDPEHWPASMERYERGLRLARQIEPRGELPKMVLSHLESRILHYDGSDPLYFSCKALELLAEFRCGDFKKLADVAGRIAAKSRVDGDYRRARSHLDVQARLLRLANENEAAEGTRVVAAETFVEEAEAREAAGSAMAAHVFWQEAVRAFRDRPSLRARIPELQKRLANAGKQTLSEMKSVSHEVDIRELVELAEREFQGLQLDDSLLKLATLNPLIDPVKLRSQVLASIKEHPLQALFDSSVYDEAGRKIAVRPAFDGADEKARESAIEGFMDHHARLQRGLAIYSVIAPALRTILSEHDITEAAIEGLIMDSAFVPEGRLPLFVRAIVEGLRWDFCTALHLFVPQAENGLRHILEQCGEVARNIDANGVEEVWGLERTLERPLLHARLGDSFIFELQSLLAGRLGPNIRNSLAHGLLSPGALNGESAFYLWWVLFRLTVMPTSAMQAFAQRQSMRPDSSSLEPSKQPNTA